MQVELRGPLGAEHELQGPLGVQGDLHGPLGVQGDLQGPLNADQAGFENRTTLQGRLLLAATLQSGPSSHACVHNRSHTSRNRQASWHAPS